MATYSDIANGLLLFAELEGNNHNISAEHDAIYAGQVIPDDLTAPELARLEAWGWVWDSSVSSWKHPV